MLRTTILQGGTIGRGMLPRQVPGTILRQLRVTILRIIGQLPTGTAIRSSWYVFPAGHVRNEFICRVPLYLVPVHITGTSVPWKLYARLAQ